MFCIKCGTQAISEAKFCARCGTALTGSTVPIDPEHKSHLQGTDQPGASTQSPIPVKNPPRVYARFWKRVGAYLIDIVIVIVGSIPISILVGLLVDSSHVVTKPTAALIQFLLGFVLLWIYFSWLEGSGKSATFGKRFLGLKVARLDGESLSQSMSASIWRNFVKVFILPFTFHVGFIISLFTLRKQALHDIMASTLVVNSSATQEEIAAAKPSDSFISNPVAVALSLIGAVVIAVLIGMAIPAMDKPSPLKVASTLIPPTRETTSSRSAAPISAKQQDPMQWSQIGTSIVDKDITAKDYIDYSRIFQTPEGYLAVWALSNFNKVQPHIPDKADDLPQHASRLTFIGIDCANSRSIIAADRLCAMSMGKGRCVNAMRADTPKVSDNKDLQPLPDGSAVRMREGETAPQAWERAQWMYPEAFGSSLDKYIQQRDKSPYINAGKFAQIASGSFERKIADAVCSR